MKRVICFFTAMLLCMHVIPICADEGVSDTIECSSQEKESYYGGDKSRFILYRAFLLI